MSIIVEAHLASWSQDAYITLPSDARFIWRSQKCIRLEKVCAPHFRLNETIWFGFIYTLQDNIIAFAWFSVEHKLNRRSRNISNNEGKSINNNKRRKQKMVCSKTKRSLALRMLGTRTQNANEAKCSAPAHTCMYNVHMYYIASIQATNKTHTHTPNNGGAGSCSWASSREDWVKIECERERRIAKEQHFLCNSLL